VALLSFRMGHQSLLLKMTWSMVIGISHRVVWYFVLQKGTKPTMNRYLNPSTNQHFIFQFGENYKLNIKQKCSSVMTERCLHSNELFIATFYSQGRGESFERFLVPQEWIRLIGLKKISTERVGYNFKIGWLYRPTLNWYFSKGSGNERKQIIFQKLVHPLEYSHPFISGIGVIVARYTFQCRGGRA